MPYTLGQAALATGCNKSTIFRAITGGRISAQRDSNGAWQIEPAELHRVFPALPAAAATPATPASPPDALTNVLVDQLQQVIADLRHDRDHWREAFQNAQRLLAAPQPPDAPAAATPATRRWWWRRATG